MSCQAWLTLLEHGIVAIQCPLPSKLYCGAFQWPGFAASAVASALGTALVHQSTVSCQTDLSWVFTQG